MELTELECWEIVSNWELNIVLQGSWNCLILTLLEDAVPNNSRPWIIFIIFFMRDVRSTVGIYPRIVKQQKLISEQEQ